MLINEKMTILELIQRYPQTVDVFHNHGMGCLGCSAASFENIEQGAIAHCIDLRALTADFNKAIEGQVCNFSD
jgi:hybrid cluster-associated redox disulfide protein